MRHKYGMLNKSTKEGDLLYRNEGLVSLEV